MAKANVLREQRMEMSNTFVAIRQKIADAQVAIRNLNVKSKDLQEQKAEADQRHDEARAKCLDLRNRIADTERDLSDAENQIPLAKSKMHELESMYGENKHFEKVLERTRKEVTDLEKRKDDVHTLAKEKAEDCWQAKQKLHKLELRVEEVDKRMEFCVRRIIVAQEKISAVDAQSTTVSKNYKEMSKNEMENKFYEKQLMVSQAKERRKASEEKAMQLSWKVEELDEQLKMYQNKMREMFSGQRELASSKLL
jgi:chromosome segregation ATPase